MGQFSRQEAFGQYRKLWSEGQRMLGRIPVERRTVGGAVISQQKGAEREVVGATGFEPATSCSQSRCSTKLSYAPLRHGAGCVTPVSSGWQTKYEEFWDLHRYCRDPTVGGEYFPVQRNMFSPRKRRLIKRDLSGSVPVSKYWRWRCCDSRSYCRSSPTECVPRRSLRMASTP
jgi:hypothetical protein